MVTEFAIVNRPVATVFGSTEKTRTDSSGRVLFNISDEALYGAVCRVLSREDGMTRILSHYGYAGYVETDALRFVSEEEAKDWLARNLKVVDAYCLDVVSEPTVRGVPLISLPAGCLLELTDAGDPADSWGKVRLADGREGWVTKVHLADKLFSEDYLWRDPEPILDILSHISERAASEQGGREKFSLQAVLDACYGGSEDAFRRHLTDTARRYLGVQYRWGGRSTFGIDCSGLVSMSYLRSGVTIFRDASVAKGFPICRIPLQKSEDGGLLPGELDKLLPGDALYFPGHIAMYLGNGKYIHSTGHAGDNGVVINSLLPGDPDFRRDLVLSLYTAGGVRV